MRIRFTLVHCNRGYPVWQYAEKRARDGCREKRKVVFLRNFPTLSLTDAILSREKNSQFSLPLFPFLVV